MTDEELIELSEWFEFSLKEPSVTGEVDHSIFVKGASSFFAIRTLLRPGYAEANNYLEFSTKDKKKVTLYMGGYFLGNIWFHCEVDFNGSKDSLEWSISGLPTDRPWKDNRLVAFLEMNT